MDNYSTLVSKVLNNGALSEAVQKIVDNNCLNLISDDWFQRLQNNTTYQDFLDESKYLWKSSFANKNYEYEDSLRPDFQVVIVGYCKFNKPQYNMNKNTSPNVTVMNSEPLKRIAQVMLTDRGPQVQISNDFKFGFLDCGVLTCSECCKCAKVFNLKGFKMDRLNQPCIVDTKVYDGKSVVNRFYSQIEEMYTQTFLAILRLKIHRRYNYTDPNAAPQKEFRISGNILDFVGFMEQKLVKSKTVDLGTLTDFIQQQQEEEEKVQNKKSNKEACPKLKNENDDFENFVKETTSSATPNFKMNLESKPEDDTLDVTWENTVEKRKFDNDETCDITLEDVKKRKIENDAIEYEVESFLLS